MDNNKDTTPTIQQTLRMIEDKLAENKENKKQKSKEQTAYKNKSVISNNTLLSNIFAEKDVDKKNVENKNKNENVLLLTKKVNKDGKIIDLKKNIKDDKENEIKKDHVEIVEKNIPNYKILNKTGDLAVIINKLKTIRDHKLHRINKKKNSKKILKEIKKLNETILLAEELFKKELLNL